MLEPGKSITVLRRGKPVFIKRRTEEEIAEARAVKIEDLPHPEKDEDRAKNPEWLVMLGICTHLGCVPLGDKGEYNGWFCVMDKVRKNQPLEEYAKKVFDQVYIGDLFMRKAIECIGEYKTLPSFFNMKLPTSDNETKSDNSTSTLKKEEPKIR